MDIEVDKIFELLKWEPGSGMVQSILLLLIWLNVRSLKFAFTKLEEGHDKRIGQVEAQSIKIEGRLTVLETHKG